MARDLNHDQITKALTDAHLSVADLWRVPERVPELANLPDVLVGGHHQIALCHINVLVEIKPPGQDLRAGQSGFMTWWKGPKARVTTCGEALACFGIGTTWDAGKRIYNALVGGQIGGVEVSLVCGHPMAAWEDGRCRECERQVEMAMESLKSGRRPQKGGGR